MAGSIEGGQKAAATNIKYYGSDFYRRIGAIGGKNGHTGGFYHMKATGQLDKLKAAGQKGGRISRRTKKEEKS